MNADVLPIGASDVWANAPTIPEQRDELSFLWLQRTCAVKAPNVSFAQLHDDDERMAAHVDALRLAGTDGLQSAIEALDNEGAEDFFVGMLLALLVDVPAWEGVVARLEGSGDEFAGALSALGWLPISGVSSCIESLVSDAHPLRQMLGIAACGQHRHDPGPALQRLLTGTSATVRARTLRTVGELGRMDLLPMVLDALDDKRPITRFCAARTALLLGERDRSLEALRDVASKTGVRQAEALRLTLIGSEVTEGHKLLQQLDDSAELVRLRIKGCGHVGDSKYVPWLVDLMEDTNTARIAAEAFVTITGADFNLDQMEAMPPKDFKDAPTDDPDDDDVALPEDVALPWPDLDHVKSWWHRNQSRFTAGQKLFMGQPVTVDHCVHVLKTGHQRQRILAAHHLSLLQPGRILFPTSAPAWRQQKLLG